MKKYKSYLSEFRAHFDEVSRPNEDFNDFAAAYKVGACLREDRPRDSWLEVRQSAIERWTELGSTQPWERVDLHVRFAFNCTKERVGDGSQGITG
jgi:hypothetical protein